MMAPAVEILLVEDNPNDLELAMHAFGRHKLANSVQIARDGQEALDYLLGAEGHEPGPRPKLILLDLKLPKVDGVEVLRRVRAQPSMRSVPIVVLTASRDERDLVETYSLGVNSYIVKPIDFDKFVETVQTLGFYWLLLNEPPPEA
jgi:two-component system, response regulator